MAKALLWLLCLLLVLAMGAGFKELLKKVEW